MNLKRPPLQRKEEEEEYLSLEILFFFRRKKEEEEKYLMNLKRSPPLQRIKRRKCFFPSRGNKNKKKIYNESQKAPENK